MDMETVESNLTEDDDRQTSTSNTTTSTTSAGGGGFEWVIACYIIVSVTGILGNALVIFVLSRLKKLRTVPNLFILHQSIVDLISSVLVFALTISDVSHPIGYVMPYLVCKLWFSRYPLWSTYMVSTLNLVSLTMERWHSILRPLQHDMLVSKSRVLSLLPVLWVMGFGFISYLFPMFNVDDTGTKCLIGRGLPPRAIAALGVANVALYYIIPISVMMFAYGSMFFEIRKQKDHAPPQAPANTNVSGEAAAISRKDKERQKIERNILKVLFLLVLVYLICWGPNQMAYLQFCLGGHLDDTTTFYHISVIMITCNVAINPIIYALKYQQFRQGLRSILCPSNRVESVESGDSSRHA